VRHTETSTVGLKCADILDAMGRLHRHRCHILDLVSPTPGRILFGPAVTISLGLARPRPLTAESRDIFGTRSAICSPAARAKLPISGKFREAPTGIEPV
jgi:hypothetical protein